MTARVLPLGRTVHTVSSGDRSGPDRIEGPGPGEDAKAEEASALIDHHARVDATAVGYRSAARAAWSRSRNGTCAAFSLRRACLSLNHSTRSISGKVSTRPDPGGHSIW